MDKLLYVRITKSASRSILDYYRNNTEIDFLNRNSNIKVSPIDQDLLLSAKEKLLGYGKYAYQVNVVKKIYNC